MEQLFNNLNQSVFVMRKRMIDDNQANRLNSILNKFKVLNKNGANENQFVSWEGIQNQGTEPTSQNQKDVVLNPDNLQIFPTVDRNKNQQKHANVVEDVMIDLNRNANSDNIFTKTQKVGNVNLKKWNILKDERGIHFAGGQTYNDHEFEYSVQDLVDIKNFQSTPQKDKQTGFSIFGKKPTVRSTLNANNFKVKRLINMLKEDHLTNRANPPGRGDQEYVFFSEKSKPEDFLVTTFCS